MITTPEQDAAIKAIETATRKLIYACADAAKAGLLVELKTDTVPYLAFPQRAVVHATVTLPLATFGDVRQ